MDGEDKNETTELQPLLNGDFSQDDPKSQTVGKMGAGDSDNSDFKVVVNSQDSDTDVTENKERSEKTLNDSLKENEVPDSSTNGADSNFEETNKEEISESSFDNTKGVEDDQDCQSVNAMNVEESENFDDVQDTVAECQSADAVMTDDDHEKSKDVPNSPDCLSAEEGMNVENEEKPESLKDTSQEEVKTVDIIEKAEENCEKEMSDVNEETEENGEKEVNEKSQEENDEKEVNEKSQEQKVENEEERKNEETEDKNEETKDKNEETKDKNGETKNKEDEKETRTSSSEVITVEDDTPTKNLRKRKTVANGYKEAETSSDEDHIEDIIVPKKRKIQPPASGKSANLVPAALEGKPSVVPITYNLGQPVSLVGTTGLLPNQQVRMVIPSVGNTVISQTGQPVLISRPQNQILTTQGLTQIPASVVLYPQIQTGSASAVMSNILTTAAQKVTSAKSSFDISIVGMTNSKNTASMSNSKTGSHVTSVTPSNKTQTPKIDKIELRTPNDSFEMIQLVKWELKQGVYHRPKNFRLKPDTELGPVAKFLRDFGQDLVKESVYSDLVGIQSRRSDHGKLTDKEKKDFQKLRSVHAELKEKVGPVKTDLSKKCKCGFRTESENVMIWHKQYPHMEGSSLNCARCDFETTNSSVFTFHMEAEHNTKAKFIEKAPFWECNLCPYETNLRNKLGQHKIRCVKNFKLGLNLHPAWLPGPEANFCLEKIFYKNPAIQNLARLQQQQQQKQMMPIMPKASAMQQSLKSKLQQSGKHYNLVNKGPIVNIQPNRNPTLLAKLGQNIQNQNRNVFQKSFAPNVNMFQGQKGTNQVLGANMARKQPTNVTYVRQQPQSFVSMKLNNAVNNQVLDKSTGNKPSGFEVCEICGGYVKDRTALRIHFFYAHRIDMPHGVFDRVHPPLYCATCFARFWTAQGLQKHLDVHKEDSSGGVAGKCIVCLHRVPNILMHMKIVHNKAFVNFLRECKCIFCGNKFQSKVVVESHMAAVHGVVVKSGSQPASSATQGKKGGKKGGQKGGKNDLVKGSVCVLCNLNFGRNVDLTRHCMRVHHTCMKCGMVVADKESLMKHSCLESPSGLRNCEICKEKGFHPAYHVKHIRDKHLKKLSIRVKRLDRKTVQKWTKYVPPVTKRLPIPTETIELSDDDEPPAKKPKVDSSSSKQPAKSSETSKDAKKLDGSGKGDEIVTLTDDEDDKKIDKSKDEDDKKIDKLKDEDDKKIDKSKDGNTNETKEKPRDDCKADDDASKSSEDAGEQEKDKLEKADESKDKNDDDGASKDSA